MKRTVTNGTSALAPEYDEIEEYFFSPTIIRGPYSINDFQSNMLKMQNEELLNRVRELEIAAYTLQTKNIQLEYELLEYVNRQQEGVENMAVHKQTPFKWLFGTTFFLFALCLILLFVGFVRVGALFGFSSLSVLFFSLYALWRVNNITLVRPQVIILGFTASLGLVATSIVSFFA
ncbi:hypothetical protein [Desulfitobacterium hafniense]|uniref:hypothetical protein n=1 Tax=Desulfitobacterium hafniense TaxID=49338 RepID=UPI0003791FCB|nr:hypothetical protein [Desulfitobacterium hafniense]